MPNVQIMVDGVPVKSFSDLGHYRIEVPSADGVLYLDVECGMQPPKPMYHDRDWLVEQYIVSERTMAEIAREFCVTPMTINQWLRAHDIQTRPRGRRKSD